jgi:hypothetical protein
MAMALSLAWWIKQRKQEMAAAIPTLTVQAGEGAAIDTYVQEAAPINIATNVTSFSVNGAAGARRNALFKFDLSSLAGETVTRAVLQIANITVSVAHQTFLVHAILAANSAWTEGANWNYAVPSTTRWAGDVGADGGTDAGCSVAGTDYNATPMGEIAYLKNSPAGTIHEINLDVAQVQALVAANHGILIRRPNSGIFSFHSSGAAVPELRPKLIIEYAP